MSGTIKVGTREFVVAKNEDDDGKGIGYFIYGKRGAVYGLLRTCDKPEIMFAVSTRRHSLSEPFPGVWFTDKDGELRIF